MANYAMSGLFGEIQRNPRIWAFTVTGIIVGGVIMSMGLFGVTLQAGMSNLAVLSLVTFVGWVIGVLIGGGLGLLGGRLLSRQRA